MYQVIRLLLIGVCLLLGVTAQAARRAAEDPAAEEARVHLKAGVLYFNAGRYEDAAREMAEAFRKKPVPELQYNLAQCYERMGAMQKAVDAYRIYLERLPAAADRAEVERRLQEIQARPAAPAPAPDGPRPTAAEPAPAPLVATPPPPPAEKVVFKEIVVYREPPPKAGRSVRIAAGVMSGLAVVGLAAGVGFLLAANNVQKNIEEQGNNSKLFRPTVMECATVRAAAMPPANDQLATTTAMAKNEICNYYDISVEARNAATASSIVGYALFAGAGAAALGLFLHGRKLDRRQAEDLRRKGELSLLPVLGAGGGGLVLAGTF